MRRSILLSAFFAFILSTAHAETLVDLELVMAVDASGSVDSREFELQMAGIAAAIRDPEVQDAIGSGQEGRIAITLAQWSEPNLPKAALPWRIVEGPDSAEAFARAVEGFSRQVKPGGTGIGKGVMYAIDLIRHNALRSHRQVIDLSGDGRETGFREWTVPIAQARDAAAVLGMTINGLAILTDETDLESYYRTAVITGQDAFAMSVAGYEGFAQAMREKLLREIENRPRVSQRPHRTADGPTGGPTGG